MKKTKYNPELLKEELKKFKLLNEYSFYTGEDDTKDKEDLILGTVEEDDKDIPDDLEPAGDTDANTDDAANNVASELGVDNNDDNDADMSGDVEDTDISQEPAPVAEPAPSPDNNDVEVDVTSLVKGSEDAKRAAEMASKNTGDLLAKFNELEGRVAAMDKISTKIDTLEKEIVKRNPTPVEKLEMRSLNSFPYSLKLTDYWNEKEGSNYDVGGQDGKKEFVLTKDDVNHSYSEPEVKQSFAVNQDDTNKLYEEEDI